MALEQSSVVLFESQYLTHMLGSPTQLWQAQETPRYFLFANTLTMPRDNFHSTSSPIIGLNILQSFIHYRQMLSLFACRVLSLKIVLGILSSYFYLSSRILSSELPLMDQAEVFQHSQPNPGLYHSSKDSTTQGSETAQAPNLAKLITAEDVGSFVSRKEPWLTLGQPYKKQRIDYPSQTDLISHPIDKRLGKDISQEYLVSKRIPQIRKNLRATKDKRKKLERFYIDLISYIEVCKSQLRNLQFSGELENAHELLMKSSKTIQLLMRKKLEALVFPPYGYNLYQVLGNEELTNTVMIKVEQGLFADFQKLLRKLDTMPRNHFTSNLRRALFTILSNLGKYQIVDEKNLRLFIANDEMAFMIEKQVESIATPSSLVRTAYLNHDLTTSLLSSISNDYMHYLLWLSKPTTWLNLEYDYIQRQFIHCQSKINDNNLIDEIVTLFLTLPNKKKQLSDQMGEIGRNCMLYLKPSPQVQIPSSNNLLAIKCFHDIFKFLMRYGPVYLPKNLVSDLQEPVFLQQFKIFDQTVACLASTVNMRYTVTKGLVTANFDLETSPHTVYLKDIRGLDFLFHLTKQELSTKVPLYFHRDKKIRSSYLKAFALRFKGTSYQSSKSLTRVVQCWEKEKLSRTSKEGNRTSWLLLEDIYLWMERIHTSWKRWKDLHQKLLDEKGKLLAMTGDHPEIRDWLGNSHILVTLEAGINVEKKKAGVHWDNFLKAFQKLNLEIDDSFLSRSESWRPCEIDLLRKAVKWSPLEPRSPLPVPNFSFE
ncbi:hypothetical protein O181_038181 [Austropuccinia psidii MF-1]|uniref:Uncharacterized protein n=1 Tax=Austropuccinia psidii MF-1 TaxID=1389203 RepID=A0A9Q3D7J3_9BASI|nr:hypothetical protein [Austropuccinia psidii MF-1]